MRIAPMPTSVTKVEKQALVLNHLLQKYHSVAYDMKFVMHPHNIAIHHKKLEKITQAYNALYSIIWQSSWRNTHNLKRNQVLTEKGYENALVLTYYNHTITVFPSQLVNVEKVKKQSQKVENSFQEVGQMLGIFNT